MSNKKLKNKPATIEDMNKLLNLLSLINIKVETAHAIIKDIGNYPGEINIQTGIHDAIEELKNKINNA